MITTTKKDGTVEVSYTGCIISVSTDSVQVMSDIYEQHTTALVFDNEDGTFKSVFLCTNYYPEHDDKREATVDATDEVKELYEAHLAAKAAKVALERAEAAREKALRQARCPGRGKTLKVVSGRKIPKGTVGVCTWYGEGRSYSPFVASYRNAGPGPMRVGMNVNGEVVYTDAKNVEVVVG